MEITAYVVFLLYEGDVKSDLGDRVERGHGEHRHTDDAKVRGRKDSGEDDDLDESHRPFDAPEPQQPDSAPDRALRERVAGFKETPEEAED